MPALYLLPSTMADGKVTDVLPARAIEVARTVRHFVVENIRTARRFLKRLDPSIDISALSFTVLDEHTAPDDIPPMLAPLAGGEAVAVVSEAGCPAIADPGADLVAAAQRRGYKVVPLVGPSSIILSLMASGFNGQSFAFSGYLPVEPAARSARLKEMTRRIRHERQTQIFIETPYRNRRLVEELVAALPPRDAALRGCGYHRSLREHHHHASLGLEACFGRRLSTTRKDSGHIPVVFMI